MNTASKIIRRFTVPPVFAAGLTRKSRVFEHNDNIKSVPPYLGNQAGGTLLSFLSVICVLTVFAVVVLIEKMLIHTLRLRIYLSG